MSYSPGQEVSMYTVFFFILAILCTFIHRKVSKTRVSTTETLLAYIAFWSIGVCSLLAFFGQVFFADFIAQQIGWAPGSPFEYEIGIANLSYGTLGVLSYWFRGRFWDATFLGWGILLLGAFIGHIIRYFSMHDTAPYNIGFFIWFYDLFLPIFVGWLWLRVRKGA